MKLFRIKGHSMEPEFREGDYVLVRKTNIKNGDTIIFKSPDGRFLIKRIAETEDHNFIARGDNPRCEPQSYTISKDNIVGKVWLK
jgi:signal peptidase I